MKEIMYRIVNSDLKEMRGLYISGDLPLGEEVVNEVLQKILSSTSPSSTDDSSDDTFQKIWNSLDKKSIRVNLENEKATLKIEIAKY